MKERPIIFSTQMVRAILRGAKTQTRRVIPVLPKRGYSLHQISEDKFCFRKVHKNGDATHSDVFRRPCDVGDLLWVRETFVGPIYDDIDDPYSDDDFENPDHCIYKADKDETPEYVDMDDNITPKDGYLIGLCKACGAPIDNGHRFCRICGQKLDWSHYA